MHVTTYPIIINKSLITTDIYMYLFKMSLHWRRNGGGGGAPVAPAPPKKRQLFFSELFNY